MTLLREELRASRDLAAASLGWGLVGSWIAGGMASLVGHPVPPAHASAYAGYSPAAGLDRPLQGDLFALGLAVLALLIVRRVFIRSASVEQFLGSLPLRPGRVLGLRLLACALVLLPAPLAHHLAWGGHHAMWGAWPPGLLMEVALPLLAGELIQCLVYLGLTWLAAVLLRRGLVVALATGALALRLLADGFPALAGLDPLRLASSSTGVLGAWLALASLGTLAGVGLRLRWGGILDRWHTRVHHSAARANLVRLSSILSGLLVVALGLAIQRGDRPEQARFGVTTVTVHTERYRFRYSNRQRVAAERLIARADSIHEGASRELGVSDPPPLEVELHEVDPDQPNQVHLGGDPEDHALRLALVTCQRMIDVRCGGRLAQRSRAARTFEEGLCRHTALTVLDRDPFWSRFHAAVIHSRRPITLHEVTDRDDLDRGRGAEAGPALGEAFVQALKLEHGAAGLQRVLDAWRDLPSSASREPQQVWQEVFERAGVSRPALRERLMAVMEDEPREDPRARIALPRLTPLIDVQLKPRGWRILAVPDLDLPPGWVVVCRVRRDPPGKRSKPPHAHTLGLAEGGSPAFYVREPRLFDPSGEQVAKAPWVQLGLRPVGIPLLETGIWEEWSAPVGPP